MNKNKEEIMNAEQILIELLDKLRDDVANMNGLICAEEARLGYADDRTYYELDLCISLINWLEERIEVKKTLKIKEK